MTVRHYANAPTSALAAACTDVATTITLTTLSGYPTGCPFTIVIDPGTAMEEVADVTAVAGTVATVTRGVDGTTAYAHDAGAVVWHALTARDATEANSHQNAVAGVHGVAGDVVGTTDAQVLTNKDLSGGNTFPASLVTETGVQALTNKDLSDASNTLAADLVTLAGAQALTNKDVSDASNTFPEFATVTQVLGASGRTTLPFAMVYKTGTQSIPNTNDTEVVFGTQDPSTTDAAMVDISPGVGRLHATRAGTYLITASIAFAANTGGNSRDLALVAAGNRIAAMRATPNTGQASQILNACGLARLASGDSILAQARQDSGGNLNIDPTVINGVVALSATWLGP